MPQARLHQKPLEKQKKKNPPQPQGKRNPGVLPAAAAAEESSSPAAAEEKKIPAALPASKYERHILVTLRSAFTPSLTSHDLTEVLQTVKHYLYERDYLTAFSKKEYLEAYAARWVPGRALCYRSVFSRVDAVRSVLRNGGNALCIGAGPGSELCAIESVRAELTESAENSLPSLQVTAIDSAAWAPVISNLRLPHLDPPPVSLQADVLSPQAGIDYASADLVTAMFVVNELFVQDRAAAITWLRTVITSMKPGGVFLICESAGSISDLVVGGEEKKVYPLQFLLDAACSRGMEVLAKEDTTWYRYPKELTELYPLQLENMRFFLRVYRKI